MSEKLENSFDEEDEDFVVAKSQKRKKPKVAGEWTESNVRSFIQAVELRRCLWDFACDDHKNGVKRASAWQSISDEFENRFTPAVLKAKWNVIKSTYTKTKAKFQSCKSGQAASDKKLPHWGFWQDMQFIYENELTNNTKSESNFTFEKFVENIIEDESNSQSILSSVSQHSTSTSATATTTSSTATTTSANVRQNRKKRNELPTPAQPQSIGEEMLSRAVDVLAKNDDEWDIFGAYIASQMRKINGTNGRSAAKLQRTINNAIMDALDDLHTGPMLISSTTLTGKDKWQIVSDPNLPPGTMQVVGIDQFLSANNNVRIEDAEIEFTDGDEMQNMGSSTVNSSIAGPSDTAVSNEVDLVNNNNSISIAETSDSTVNNDIHLVSDSAEVEHNKNVVQIKKRTRCSRRLTTIK